MKKFNRRNFLKTNTPLYLLVKPKVELVVEMEQELEPEVKLSKHKRKKESR